MTVESFTLKMVMILFNMHKCLEIILRMQGHLLCMVEISMLIQLLGLIIVGNWERFNLLYLILIIMVLIGQTKLQRRRLLLGGSPRISSRKESFITFVCPFYHRIDKLMALRYLQYFVYLHSLHDLRLIQPYF